MEAVVDSTLGRGGFMNRREAWWIVRLRWILDKVVRCMRWYVGWFG